MKQMEKFTYNGLLLITNSIFLAIIYWICHGRVYIYSTGKTGGYPNMDEPGGYTEYRNLECEEDADKFALKYANAVLRMVAAMTETKGE